MKNKYKWVVVSTVVSALVVLTVVYINRKKILAYSKQKVWDIYTEYKIETLHPKVRSKARQLINEADKNGLKLRITSAKRSYAEQDKLYAQGRTTNGEIVTNAKAGYSAHNFGTAFDVVPMIDGDTDWDTKEWDKIGLIGKSLGFTWGGDWNSIIDKPHFEMNFGNTIAQLREKYNGGDILDGYVKI